MKFEDLKGETITKIEGVEQGDDLVTIILADGRKCEMSHDQNCCENVSVEDVCGDIADIIGTPILEAREEANGEEPKDIKKEYQDDSFTWTFYIIRTIKGSVTIRWYGESNGYYSEDVDFREVK